MKTCFKCGAEKPLTEYYKHKEMADGHLNKCKSCARSDVKKNRNDNLEYYKAYDKQRHENDPVRRAKNHAASKAWRQENKERHTELTNAWRKRNPEKRIAHNAVGYALRSGKIVKENCAVCGADNAQAHHNDYTKPLDVVWLCPKHHAQVHVDERKNP